MRLPYRWNSIAGTRVTVFVGTMAGVDEEVKQATDADFLAVTGDQETTCNCNAAIVFDPEELGKLGKTVTPPMPKWLATKSAGRQAWR